MCLNGGPHFTINPSISFYVVCTTEEEVNHAWEKLLKTDLDPERREQIEFSIEQLKSSTR